MQEVREFNFSRNQLNYLLLRNTQAPGDLVVLTALVRDIHRCYPGRFVTGLNLEDGNKRATAPRLQVFENNPYVTPLDKEKYPTFICHYPHVHSSNEGKIHFLAAFHAHFNGHVYFMHGDRNRQQRVHLNVMLTEAKPDLHLTEAEKRDRLISEPYWIIVSGGKRDFTAKVWDPSRWQKVVDAMRGKVKFVQVGAPRDPHPPLNGVTNLVGQTDFRELMRLVYHADGVLCPVTCLMHLAAAFEKPCVVVAGGREPWWWEWYTSHGYNFGGHKPPVPHVYLHTQGSLPCCDHHGCWKSKVKEGNSRCARPVQTEGGVTIPECLAMIKPEDVIRGMEMYLDGDMNAVDEFCRKHAQGLDWKPLPKPQPKAEQRQPTVTVLSENKLNPARRDIPQMDHEVIGGKLTICALLYGDYHDIHVKCLKSIIDTVPKHRMELRIGCNEVCPATLEWLQREVVPAVNPIMYVHSENKKKYPVMREMFHDPERPLNTKWLIWFDDDSYAESPQWIDSLVQTLIQYGPQGFKMFGKRYYLHLEPGQKEWIEQAAWYRGKPILFDKAKERYRVDFITGGWWAILTDVIRELDWPDRRINHNGGDVMLSAAMAQFGYKDKNYYKGIAINSKERRGYSEKPAGTLVEGKQERPKIAVQSKVSFQLCDRDIPQFDHPAIGGKITICTLLYGDYPKLHRRNVESIISTVPKHRMDLRIGCNEVCDETMNWLKQEVIPTVDPIMYIHSENKKKYPVMREMFHDPDRPVTTKWITWFDDDSYAENPLWIDKLLEALIEYGPQGYKLFGKKYFIHLHPGQKEWIEQSPWYKGKPVAYDQRCGKYKVNFITGGWWTIALDLVKELDWPDPRILHCGGDKMLGAAMDQFGYKSKNHSFGMRINTEKRRGYSEKPIGAK